MKTRITILCENFVGRLVGLGEHGFSAFIETNHGNYLFDTGGGRSIVPNALALDKDLKSVKKIFLSHGHYDHTGGLPEVLKLKGKADVHAHPHILLDRTAVLKENGKERNAPSVFPIRETSLNLWEQILFSIRILPKWRKVFSSAEKCQGTNF